MRATSPLAVIGLTAFLVFGTAAIPAHATQVSVVIAEVTYTADNANIPAGATATYYDNTLATGTVAIPSNVTIGGTNYAVTTIGDNAFHGNRLTSVTLPDTLTTIGNDAFFYNRLTTVSLPNTLTTIGRSAFSANSLTSVSLPNTLTTIGNNAFNGNRLTSVSLPNTLTTISDNAFGSNALTSVSLPDTVTTIGDGAFAYNRLASVSLPNALTTIGKDAFGTNALSSVSLPDTLTTIGDFAFDYNRLTSVSLPDTLTTIGESAFLGNSLTSVRFLGAAPANFGSNVFTSNPTVSYYWSYGDPQTSSGFTTPSWKGYTTEAIAILTYDTNGGTAIDPAETVVGKTATTPAAATKADYTFDGWYTAATGGTVWNFTADTVPGDMTLFAHYAAQVSTTTNTGITYTADSTNISAGATATDHNPASGPAVAIPSNVTIGGTDYTVTTIGNNAFYGNSLTSVSLPNTVTTIGDNAFAGNSLTSVSLPNTVTTIGERAFADNSDLASVRFLGAAPASFGSGVFTSNPLVSYYWRYGDPQTSSGFTTPSWKGYTTEAIAILTDDTNGGTAIDPVETVVGKTATTPGAAVKADYTFDGWYTAATGGTVWDFTADTVPGDMTLFAHYIAVPATPTGQTGQTGQTGTAGTTGTTGTAGTTDTVLAATGVAIPAIPAGIAAVLLLAGIALLTRRRHRA